ncbi:MAG: TonB-dependent receptor [Bacteroidales bacterium]|jgi:TonB-linked SusC/RagA family outer membrane protein
MKRLTTLLTCLCFTFLLNAQEKTISGNVTAGDTNGPLPGVSIVIQGTTRGTITDTEGNFSIRASEGDVLEVSFVGYLTESITVGNETELSITLISDIMELDELVVIGYGTEKKSLVTGSISKVSEDEITSSPSLRTEQAIQGRVSGVSVSQTSGQPGAAFTVRIRGTGSNANSEPIYIVDGMRMEGIDGININDIESIEILKDAASAAIYGSQGANGVVLITTKSGVKGQTAVSYKFYYGWQEIANKKFGVLNSDDYLDYRWRALLAEGEDAASITDPEGDYHLPEPGQQEYDTDWLDEAFNVAPMTEHNLTVSGGSEKSTYVFSGSYFSQDGIAGGDKANFTRYTARFNADYDLKPWLNMGNRFHYNHTKRTSLPENSVFNSYMNMAINMDPLTPVTVDSYEDLPEFVRIQAPEYVVRDDDGNYYGISEYVSGEVYNPIALQQVQHGVYTLDKLIGSVYADISPLKGLNYRTKFDIDLSYGNNDSWDQKRYFNLENDNFNNGVSRSVETWFNWQWGNILTYDTHINDHDIGVLAGMESRTENYKGVWATGRGLIKEDNNFALINTTVDSLSRSDDAITETKWLSYFGRISYKYREKYLLSAVLRVDGSSLFGPENKFGYFPSVSLGWVVSNESFWTFPFINFMKVRASWGQNGSTSNLGQFEYISLITEGYQYPNANGSIEPAAEPRSLSNPNLQWETSEQTDIGIDMAFLQNKFSLTLDYYRKITRDLLTRSAVPTLYGNYQSFVNAGDVLNTGIEAEISHKNVIGEFRYSVNFNAAYNYNEVLSTAEQDRLEGVTLFLEDGPITIFEEGHPVWYYSAYVSDGIFQTEEEIEEYANVAGIRYQPDAQPGDVKFKDINKDGAIDVNDRIDVGNPHPDWMLGLNLTFEYKQFDLGIFFQSALGHQIVNALNRSDRFGYNKPQFYYDMAWDGEGSTNEWFRPSESDPNRNFRNSDLFVEDADYLRLKNIQLGFNFAKIGFFRDAGIKNARLYVSAQNLFTVTKYKGLEPEIGAVSRDSNDDIIPSSIGIDYGFYPVSRIYQVGLNVTF